MLSIKLLRWSFIVAASVLWFSKAEAQQLRIRSDGNRPEGQLYGQEWSRFDDGLAHAAGSRSASTGRYALSTTRVISEKAGPTARIRTRCHSSITDVEYKAIIPVANKLLR